MNHMANLGSDIDRKIDYLERKLLLHQERVIKQKENATAVVKRLERQLKAQEEVKKEWIRKINIERERLRVEKTDSMRTHRLNMEDLRLKFGMERANKLREVKVAIQEEEHTIGELQKQRDEGVMKTKAEEKKITAQFQEKINELLREEESVARSGVIRQKRLLESGNIYSMDIDKVNPIGMKRRSGVVRRPY